MDYPDLDNTSPEPQTASTFENNSTYPDFSNYTFSQKISFAYDLMHEFFFPLLVAYLVYYLSGMFTLFVLFMSSFVGFNGIILRLLDNDRRKPEVKEIFIPLNDNRVIRLFFTMLLFSVVIIITIIAFIFSLSLTRNISTFYSLEDFIVIFLIIIVSLTFAIALAIANIIYSIMSFYLVEFEADPWEAIKNSFAIFKASWKHWLKALGIVIVIVGSIPIIIIFLLFSLFISSSTVILDGNNSIYEVIGCFGSFFITLFIQIALAIIQVALITLYSSIIYGMAYREIMKPENIIEDNN